MTTELWLECLDKYLYHREEETCKLYYVRHYGLFATITRSKVAVEDWRVSLYFKHLSQSPAPLVIAKLRDGSPILVRLDDYVGRSIYYFGDLDRKITWVCQRVLRPGDTMLDIGANYGLLTLYAAKLVGSTGCVHAFEPQPALIELIRKSVEISNFSQVSVHDFALSLNDEVGYMSVEPWNSGQAALVSTEVSTNAPKIQVKVRKTSDYLSRLSLKNIRLVKLDVECHEASVLQGGLEFFEDCKPDVMVFEANEEGKTFWEREVIKLVVSLGYDLFEIPKSKFRVRLRKLNHGNSPQPSSWDFVAIRQGETYKNVIPSLDYMVYKTSNSSVLTYPIPPGKTNSKTEECYGEDSYGSASTMQRDLQNEWHNMR